MTDKRDNQTPAQPNVVYVNQHDKPVKHGLHLFLSVITLGAWLPVWLIVAIARR
jgi:hypothetical protein